jgi:hypothetical protein
MVTRYAVTVAVDVIQRPARAVAESADTLAELAKLLPKDAQLRELQLPDTTGLAELHVDLDANSAADALSKLNLAVELVAAVAVGDLNSLGPLRRACVIQYDGPP